MPLTLRCLFCWSEWVLWVLGVYPFLTPWVNGKVVRPHRRLLTIANPEMSKQLWQPPRSATLIASFNEARQLKVRERKALYLILSTVILTRHNYETRKKTRKLEDDIFIYFSLLESLPVWWRAKQFKLLVISGSSLAGCNITFSSNIDIPVSQLSRLKSLNLWSLALCSGILTPAPTSGAQPTHSHYHQKLSEQGFGTCSTFAQFNFLKV